MSVLRELGLFDHADARVGSTHWPNLLPSRHLLGTPWSSHNSEILLRTRPSRPKLPSSKPALLLALLSISGGNAFASVATLSADPTLVVLELPALCTTITAALLWPRCMKVAVSMEKPPGTCFAGGGANGLELRRSLWLEAGSVRQRRRADSSPLHHHNDCCALARLHAGCHKHGEAARDLFCGRRRQWA